MHPNTFWSIIVISLLQLILSSEAGRSVTVYADKDHYCSKNLFKFLVDPGSICITLDVEEGDCENFNNYDDKISSINTHGNCFVVWQEHNCRGNALQIFPGSSSHNDLSQINMIPGVRNWDDEISSISVCPPNCTLKQFTCVGGKCVDKSLLCDGDLDCPNGDDELNCPTNTTVQNATTTTSRPEIISEEIRITSRDELKSAMWVTPEGKVVEVYFECNSTCQDQKVFIQDYDNYVFFYLYTKQNTEGVPIRPGNMTNMDKFMKGKETKIISHGYWSNCNVGLGPTLKKAYLEQNDDMNVILIDWSKLASTWWYPWAVGYTKDVAKITVRLIEFLNNNNITSLENVHFIGHSLGSHIGGLVGEYLRQSGTNQIRRITGLDPPGPGYEKWGRTDSNCGWYLDARDRLTPDDAEFVDIIHTDASLRGWGQVCPTGSVDYYPNWPATRQPGCSIPDYICSHSIAYDYFGESVSNPFAFYGCECGSARELENGKCVCSQNDRIAMGETTSFKNNGDPNSKHLIHLKTRPIYPRGCERSLNCDACSNPGSTVSTTLKNFTFTANSSDYRHTVVGGVPVPPNAVPWMISLISLFGDPAGHSCGGILIRADLILTAAHCVNPDTINYVIAMAGRHFLDRPLLSPPKEQIRYIQSHVIHHLYRYNPLNGNAINDLALLYTNTPFDITPEVDVATLQYDRNYIPGTRIITGWGRTGGGLPVSNELLQADLQSVDCRTYYPNPIHAGWVCAGDAIGGGCQGDSGGPLHASDTRVIGVVSSGSLQCDTTTVFMDLEYYRSWIELGKTLCISNP